MPVLQKAGGAAALYLAAAYVIGITLFIVVLDYPNMTDAAARVALLVDKPMVIFATNLILYVIFGIVLIVLVMAIYDLLKSHSPALVTAASIIGIIWAGSLIASGMVLNAGIDLTLGLHVTDPVQAALVWAQFEAVSSGLGNGNGEILGGLMTLLFSWAGLAANRFPKVLNYLGVVVGLVGMVTTVPGLNDLASVFAIGQIFWFVGLAIVMLRPNPGRGTP